MSSMITSAMPSSALPILIADDDADDREFTREAFEECRLRNELHFVEDGQQAIDWLGGKGRPAGARSAPRPALVLLDLMMPRKNGFEVLREIRANPALRHLPVVVLTTSSADEDVVRSYALGVNSFITKPVTFAGLVEAIQALGRYWFEIVALPPGGQDA